MAIDLGPKNEIHRFPSKEAAELVVEKMQPLTDAKLAIIHDPVSESERERGVGDYVIVCWSHRRGQRLRCDDSYRMSRCADMSLSLALADALAESNPDHPLLQVWHLQKDNRGKLSRYYVEREI